MRKMTLPLRSLAVCAMTMLSLSSQGMAAEEWLVFESQNGPGVGKHIVLVSGDDEYRSEELMPQLGKILATRHGFKCTVLFPIDPADGTIKPNFQTNIPGLEALDSADLIILGMRFRNLPDEQMAHFDKYIHSGKPIIALRTSTHAFNLPEDSTYAKYSWTSKVPGWEGGFGKQVLGETWVAHHGNHGHQATRGIVIPEQSEHPILKGIKSGDVWGPTDVYTVTTPLPDDSQPILLGEVVEGMKPDDPPAKGEKNDPMMPIAWTKTYTGDSGKAARIFTTTMGSSEDLLSEGFRRLIVNACYWGLGLEEDIKADANVDLIGEYHPTHFMFDGHKKGVKPVDLK